MTKLRAREIDVPIYPNGTHILAFHLLGLGFLDVYCFALFLSNIYAFKSHCNRQFRGQ
jgi:hypothetical protein